MDLYQKHFHELTNDELWEIYQLRTAVFVVEQNCAYQEVDQYDKEAIHLFMKDENGIEAYARVLPKGCTFDTVSSGRVISKMRRSGLGTAIVKEAITTAVKEYDCDEITIEAQVYARRLYEKCGFVQTSEEFLEDGIPHIQMKWRKAYV